MVRSREAPEPPNPRPVGLLQVLSKLPRRHDAGLRGVHGRSADEVTDDVDALFPPVLLVLPEGAGDAVGERPALHLPPPGGARRRRGARRAVAARAVSRARRRRPGGRRVEHHHRASRPASSRPGALPAAGARGSPRSPLHGPLLRQLRDERHADAGARGVEGRARPHRRGAVRGPPGPRHGLWLARGEAGRPHLGGGRGLQHGGLRRRAVPLLCRLGPPDRARVPAGAGLPLTPARKTLVRPRRRRGPPLPPLLPPRRPGPRLRAACAPSPLAGEADSAKPSRRGVCRAWSSAPVAWWTQPGACEPEVRLTSTYPPPARAWRPESASPPKGRGGVRPSRPGAGLKRSRERRYGD